MTLERDGGGESGRRIAGLSEEAAALFGRLVEIMARLRSPGGCPWDREQNLQTIKDYMLEEAHEVYEAARTEDWDELAEELGDLAFEIVFLARIAEEAGRFDIRRSLRSIVDKLVRRHPHVFAGLEISDPDDVNRNWRAIKAEERSEKRRAGSELDGVPRSLPPLLQAQRLLERSRPNVTREDARSALDSAMSRLARLREGLGEGDDEGTNGGKGASENPGEATWDLLSGILFDLALADRFFDVGLSSALLSRLDRFRNAGSGDVRR